MIVLDTNHYVKLALRTESQAFYMNEATLNQDTRLIHAAMGLATEAGEFLDPLKKALFYGKPVDKVNLTEELGDIMWYIAIACDALGVELGDVMQRNITKLATRYPDKFTTDAAINRDLDAERKVLEGYEDIGVIGQPHEQD